MKQVVNCPHTTARHYSRGRCRPCYEADLKRRNPEYAEAQRRSRAAWNAANPTRRAELGRLYQRKKGPLRTALKRAQLASALAKQGGLCAICGTGAARRWHQDHDHLTGALRGVLCSKCNNGLGFFDDDIELHAKALQYLGLHVGIDIRLKPVALRCNTRNSVTLGR